MAPLATPDQLETYLGQAVDPDRAAMILDQVSAVIRTYCSWHIAPQITETITVDGHGSRVLVLPTLHLVAVTEIVEDGETVDLSTVDWSAAGFLERRDVCWTSRPGVIQVTMTHGFEVPPDDVVSLCLSLTAQAMTAPVGVVQESAGGESVTYSQVEGSSGGVLLPRPQRWILDRLSLADRP